MLDYPQRTVLELCLHSCSKRISNRFILKFNSTIIRYCIIEHNRAYRYVIDLTKCLDYSRYKRIYRLLYGV